MMNAHPHTDREIDREREASERLACWGCRLATPASSWVAVGLSGWLACWAHGRLAGCLSGWPGGWLADGLAHRNML